MTGQPVPLVPDRRDVERATSLLEQGCCVADIATLMGLSWGEVRRLLAVGRFGS